MTHDSQLSPAGILQIGLVAKGCDDIIGDGGL